MARTVLSASPMRRATCRAAALSHACPTASSKALAIGRFARQRFDLLRLHPAIWTTDTVLFHDHRRLELETGQIPHLPLVDLVDVVHPSPATRTPQYPIAALAAHPQLQSPVLLVDLVAIDPVTRPAKHLGELVVGWQTLKSTESRRIESALHYAALQIPAESPHY
jgi:hypothetical protein